MMTVVLALLVACGGPVPTTITFAGEQAAVHTMDPVAVQAAVVNDAEGKALAAQPAVTWTVTPETVAKLDGTNIVPVGNGEAIITAASGDIKAEYKLAVALPDAVEIGGYVPGDVFPVGSVKQLTGMVKSGGAELKDIPVKWTSDAPAVTIDDKGMATAAVEGPANITATAGAATATLLITVAPAAPATADAAAPL